MRAHCIHALLLLRSEMATQGQLQNCSALSRGLPDMAGTFHLYM